MERIAVYFAPAADGDLWWFGSEVIGYDAVSGRDISFPSDIPVSPDIWMRMTADPRRYGFHATLKAPFRLRDGVPQNAAIAIADRVAASLSPVELPRLAVRQIGAFVALVPDEPSPELNTLASVCVDEFEPIRAPLSEAERARRLAAPLTDQQLAHLDAYGYPYVHDQFRFHMTLTGPLPPDLRKPAMSWLVKRYEARVQAGLSIDSICIFGQAARDARFRVLERVPLRG